MSWEQAKNTWWKTKFGHMSTATEEWGCETFRKSDVRDVDLGWTLKI